MMQRPINKGGNEPQILVSFDSIIDRTIVLLCKFGRLILPRHHRTHAVRTYCRILGIGLSYCPGPGSSLAVSISTCVCVCVCVCSVCKCERACMCARICKFHVYECMHSCTSVFVVRYSGRTSSSDLGLKLPKVAPALDSTCLGL